MYTSAECPGGHCTLMQNVRGDKFLGGHCLTVGRGRDREGSMPAIAGRDRDRRGSNPISRPSGTCSN